MAVLTRFVGVEMLGLTSEEGVLSGRGAFALILISWILYVVPWLIGGKVIPFDSASQFYPAAFFSVGELLQGRLPLWNPYVFGGYPQFADPQMMTFQPLLVLPLMLDQSLWWFDKVVLLNVLMGGIGCYFIGRWSGLQPESRAVMALVFMFGAVAASRLQHTPMIIGYSLVPWIWLGLLQLRAQLSVAAAVRLGVLGAIFGLQLTHLTWLFAIVFAGCAVFGLSTAADRFRFGWLHVLALGLAILGSSIQTIGTLAFLPETNRVSTEAAQSLQNVIYPEDLFGVLSANFFGHLSGEYWGRGDISQNYLYFGAMPVVVIALGLPRLWVELRGGLIFCIIAIVLAFLYALGPDFKVYNFFRALPGGDLFRRPADAMFVVVAALAYLSGASFDAILRAGVKPGKMPFTLIAVTLAAGLIVALNRDLFAQARMVLICPLLLMAGTFFCCLKMKTLRHASFLVLILLAGDLLVSNSGKRFNALDSYLYVSSGAADMGGRASPEVVSIFSTGEVDLPQRVEVVGLWPWSNGLAVKGVYASSGYNPLIYKRVMEFFGYGPDPLPSLEYRSFTAWTPSYAARSLDLLGVRWVARGVVMPNEESGIEIMSRTSTYARVLTPSDVRYHDDEYPPPDAFGNTDFEETVWLQGEDERSEAYSCAGKATVIGTRYRSSHIDVEYSADEPAWLVINEVYGNGWEATVGGQSLVVERANGMFRAVCVPGTPEGSLRLSFSPLRMLRENLLSSAK